MNGLKQAVATTAQIRTKPVTDDSPKRTLSQWGFAGTKQQGDGLQGAPRRVVYRGRGRRDARVGREPAVVGGRNAVTPFQIRHLGIAVNDLDEALAFYQRAFGYSVVSGPFDDPIQKVRVCFIGAGSADACQIELIAPAGPESPVHRTLAKGIGGYHICYEVDDAEESLKAMRAQGCVPVSKPVPAVAFGGRRIAWFFTPTQQLVEIVERTLK
jgi:methylmalonyl-CoA/ethylmalonyl-CoA epimerase